jgi:hypothetical protein
MMFGRQAIGSIVVAVACLSWAVPRSVAQEPARPQGVEIPKTATLEGIPSVRIESTEQGSKRRVLGKAEASENRLSIQVKNGQFYWASRENRPLEVDSSGGFTYLSSKPGSYIKFTKVNDKISYVEHVDQGLNSVTYWGELRIVIGK